MDKQAREAVKWAREIKTSAIELLDVETGGGDEHSNSYTALAALLANLRMYAWRGLGDRELGFLLAKAEQHVREARDGTHLASDASSLRRRVAELREEVTRLERQASAGVTKKPIPLKNGDVVPKGTKVEIRFLGERDPNAHRLCLFAFDWNGPSGRDYQQEPMKIAITRAADMVTGIGKAPNMAALERMADNGVATTPTGKRTEPDGYGSDGSPSWLLVLGYI